MFSKSSKNVFSRTYDSSIEDFAAENASVLDTWVLHHFKVNEDSHLMNLLNSNKFFFELSFVEISLSFGSECN